MKVSRVIEWDLRNGCVQYIEGENSTLFSTFVASPLRKQVIDFSFGIIRKSHYLTGLFERSFEHEKEPLLALASNAMQGGDDFSKKRPAREICLPRYLYNPVEPISEVGYNHFGVPDIAKLCLLIDGAISRGEEKFHILNIGSFSWLEAHCPFLNEKYPEMQFHLYGITSKNVEDLPASLKGLFNPGCAELTKRVGICVIDMIAGFDFTDDKIHALPKFDFMISNGVMCDLEKPHVALKAFCDQLTEHGVFVTPGFKLFDEHGNLETYSFLLNFGRDFFMFDSNFPRNTGSGYYTFCIGEKRHIPNGIGRVKVSIFTDSDGNLRMLRYVQPRNSIQFFRMIVHPLTYEVVRQCYDMVRRSHHFMRLFERSFKEEKFSYGRIEAKTS